VFGERLIRHTVQFASPRIAFDPLVETLSVKHLVPRAEPVKVRRESCAMAFSISSTVFMTP
jgi:hypothetical protein